MAGVERGVVHGLDHGVVVPWGEERGGKDMEELLRSNVRWTVCSNSPCANCGLPSSPCPVHHSRLRTAEQLQQTTQQAGTIVARTAINIVAAEDGAADSHGGCASAACPAPPAHTQRHVIRMTAVLWQDMAFEHVPSCFADGHAPSQCQQVSHPTPLQCAAASDQG